MWSCSDDEKVVFKAGNFKGAGIDHIQLLKWHFGPGSMEIGGRTEKAFQLCSRSTTLY